MTVLLSVVGARPNFMKLAPLARALTARDGVRHVIVHTGQHYDAGMSAAFFEDLAIQEPDHDLGGLGVARPTDRGHHAADRAGLARRAAGGGAGVRGREFDRGRGLSAVGKVKCKSHLPKNPSTSL